MPEDYSSVDFASDLDNALLTHQKDPKTGLPMKGQGEGAPDHLTDSLAYVVATPYRMEERVKGRMMLQWEEP